MDAVTILTRPQLAAILADVDPCLRLHVLDWFVEPTDDEPAVPHLIEEILLPGWQTPALEALRRLLHAGYSYGVPDGVLNSAAEQLLGSYRHLECDQCGNLGPHTVHLFVRDRSMRGLVICSVCNKAIEI